MDLSKQKTWYIVVRNDLTDSQKAVHATHAGIEGGRHILKDTDIHPKTIIVLVKSEYKLKKLMDDMPYACIPFRERDMGGEYTSFITRLLEDDEREYFKRYQLL